MSKVKYDLLNLSEVQVYTRPFINGTFSCSCPWQNLVSIKSTKEAAFAEIREILESKYEMIGDFSDVVTFKLKQQSR